MGFAVTLLLALVAAASLDARAEEAPSEGTSGEEVQAPEMSEEEALALASFEAAKTLYAEEQFDEAAAKFREANRIRPTWKLFFNIGQSEAAAKRNGLAVEAFEQYLAQGGDEIPKARHELVISEIKRLRPIVGFVNISTTPAGATVLIDDMERGALPLSGPLMVAAGIDHVVKIVDGDEVVLDRKVRVAGEQTVTIDVDAETGPEPPPEPEPEVSPSVPSPDLRTDDGSAKRGLGIAGVSLGAALLASGAVTGGLALSQFKKLENACNDDFECERSDESLRTRADTLALVTDVLIPLGAVVGTVGVVLLVLGKKADQSTAKRDVGVRPVIGPTQGGLLLEGRF